MGKVGSGRQGYGHDPQRLYSVNMQRHLSCPIVCEEIAEAGVTAEWAAWTAAAERAGASRSEWIRGACNARMRQS